MSEDLVERLREAAKPYLTADLGDSAYPEYLRSTTDWSSPDAPLLHEAADEIERLHAEKLEAAKAVLDALEDHNAAMVEIERLRAELRKQDEWRTGPAQVELVNLRAEVAELREDIASVLKAFDDGLFIRNTKGDEESGWAFKFALPLSALARLASKVLA